MNTSKEQIVLYKPSYEVAFTSSDASIPNQVAILLLVLIQHKYIDSLDIRLQVHNNLLQLEVLCNDVFFNKENKWIIDMDECNSLEQIKVLQNEFINLIGDIRCQLEGACDA